VGRSVQRAVSAKLDGNNMTAAAQVVQSSGHLQSRTSTGWTNDSRAFLLSNYTLQ